MAAAVTTGAQVGVFQVAIVWGLGIAIAITVCGGLSGAHLNPAVTLSMAVWNSFPWRRVLPYMGVQLLGAFAGGLLVLGIFQGAIVEYEGVVGVVRGAEGSEATAMIFGEFYPNPGGEPLSDAGRRRMSSFRAFGAEVVGTAVLLLVIFGVTDERNPGRPRVWVPLAIGLTVTLLISLLGPLTMACFNPARDLGPRLLSVLAGWGSLPFKVNGIGWLTVYVLAPFLGGLLGGAIYHYGFRSRYGGGD